MRTIKELLQEKTVYFKFNDSGICYRFLSDAQREGLTVGHHTEPCQLSATDLIVWVPEGYLCRVGWAGRILYRQNSERVIRIDYEKYLAGTEDYILLP